MLMATPQKPIAHDGSVTVTSVKALTASSYQNSAAARRRARIVDPPPDCTRPGRPPLPVFLRPPLARLPQGPRAHRSGRRAESRLSVSWHTSRRSSGHRRLTVEKTVCQLRADTPRLADNLSSVFLGVTRAHEIEAAVRGVPRTVPHDRKPSLPRFREHGAHRAGAARGSPSGLWRSRRLAGAGSRARPGPSEAGSASLGPDIKGRRRAVRGARFSAAASRNGRGEIGRASCRERVSF